MPLAKAAPDLGETARHLARAHMDVDPDVTVILRAADPRDQEVRLVEISTSTPTTREVFAFGFDADPTANVWHRSQVVLLSPREFEELRAHCLDLPEGWGTYDDLVVLEERAVGHAKESDPTKER